MQLGLQQRQQQKQNMRLSQQMLTNAQIFELPLNQLKQYIDQAVESNPTLSIDTVEEGFPQVQQVLPSKRATGFVEQKSIDDVLQNIVLEQRTLQGYLNWQIELQPIEQSIKEILLELVSDLNEDGFISPWACEQMDKNQEYAKAQKILMQLDPLGVGACHWQQAIEYQVQHICSKRFQNYCQQHPQWLQEYEQKQMPESFSKDISMLNPFPGRQYRIEQRQYIIPDAKIWIENGMGHIHIYGFPHLKLDRHWVNIEQDKISLPEKKYLKGQIQQAKILLNSLDKRAENFQKFLQALLILQKAFFLHGPTHIQSLTLKQMSEWTHIGISSLSRLTKDKYIYTPWGVMALKRFFSWQWEDQKSGKKYSQRQLIEKVQSLCQENEKWSDEKIKLALEKENIHISRRTVNKYRHKIL